MEIPNSVRYFRRLNEMVKELAEEIESEKKGEKMRLIDADELMQMIPTEEYDARMAIIFAPTVDAEPVRHGHWCVTQAYPHTIYCSECFQRFAQAHWAVWEDGSLPRDYCPHCGAKMDGERREDAKTD